MTLEEQLEEELGVEVLDRLAIWAMSKVKYNRRLKVYRVETVHDYFQQAVTEALTLKAEKAFVSFHDGLLVAEAIRAARNILDKRGYRSGEDGEQKAPYEVPIDPQLIRAGGEVQQHDWTHFQADAKRILCEVNPTLWLMLKWFLKNHPVSRREYQNEYKRRQRLPEEWGEGDNTPKTPGFTMNELAKEFGVHRNTISNYRSQIKNLLRKNMGSTYSFLKDVLHVVEMA